ncbi:MAG: DUF4433 domain-containing protein [Anaerolineaceae bacterium]|nr:DUF4433 domain-containing protein [Anaerolineaceae bacterium]
MVSGKHAFYHITPVSNLTSVFERGLYSHDQLVRRSIQFSIVYDPDIVERRGRIPTGTRRSLHEYVNLYFNPRNAMMYLIKAIEQRDVAVVQVNVGVLDRKDVWLADGNAAASATSFHPVGTKTLAQLRQQVDRESWNDPDESVKKENSRQMMAECLVPVHISSKLIEAVHVFDRRSAEAVIRLLSGTGARIYVNPYMFFSSGEKREFVRRSSRPMPVGHSRSIPQHSAKIAIQQTKTPAKEVFVSSATTAAAAPANASATTSLNSPAAVPVSASASARRKAKQTRKSEGRTPVHSAAVSSRRGGETRPSRLWEWLSFLLMIFFVLALYETFRRLLA